LSLVYGVNVTEKVLIMIHYKPTTFNLLTLV